MKYGAIIALCALLCNALVAATLLDGERSFAVDFSDDNPRPSFSVNISTSGSLVKGGEVSFDLFIDDATLFVVGYVYFGSDGGWYLHGLAPEKCGEWETFRFPVSSLGVEGTPAGLDKIHTIRLVLRRGGRGKGTVKIRNVVCGDVVSPGLTEAERLKLAANERSRILTMPGKKGERRFAWCHTAYGPYKGDWDRAVRETKDLGFTDLIVNQSWGVNSAYDSNVLPTAKALDEYGDLLEKCKTACRSHGIKFHVWRMCWRIAEWYTPKEEVDALEAEGLLQRSSGGQVLRKWLCPTNPKNRKREAAAMLELASKGVDGIQFDTIRYASYDTCFCDGCRKMFEKRIGRTLSDRWNVEIWNDESLKKEWRDFRAEVISSLVRGVSKRVHEQYPGVEVSAAVFFDPVEDRNGSGQDWAGWCREGLLDFVCPMDYSKSALMFRSRLRVQKEYSRHTPFYPGIGLSIFPSDGLEAGRIADQIAVVREEGFGGFTVFQYEAKTVEILKLLSEGPCGLWNRGKAEYRINGRSINESYMCNKPSSATLDGVRGSWFKDARFGMFIHWGIYSIPGKGVWSYAIDKYAPGEYEANAKIFNPTNYNPHEWARLAKRAGMKYAVLTTRHHDGFCMFDSHFTDYKITNTPYGRDAVREYVEAFRAEGLKVGFYHSLPDWTHPGYSDPETPAGMKGLPVHDSTPEEYAAFKELVANHVHQLMTEYGKIDLLFFDYTSKYKQNGDYFDRERLLKIAYENQPGIIVNDRLSFWKDNVRDFDYYTPEICVPSEPIRVKGREVAWETCATINGHWGYNVGDNAWKTPEALIAGLVGCVSRGGNLLLNVGPMADGSIPAPAVARLNALGDWYAANGESIFGCGKSDLTPPFGCAYTQKGNTLFCHFLQQPLGDVILPGLKGRVASATLLRTGEAVECIDHWGFELLKPDDQRIRVKGIVPGDVVKIELKKGAIGAS